MISWSLLTTAMRHGGRYAQLWFTALFHGLVVECVSYMLPDIDSFWHGHSMVVFFKQRLPLHIVLFCKHSCVVNVLRSLFWRNIGNAYFGASVHVKSIVLLSVFAKHTLCKSRHWRGIGVDYKFKYTNLHTLVNVCLSIINCVIVYDSDH